MPYISPYSSSTKFGSASNGSGPASSSANSAGGRLNSNILDRFGGARASIYERPSTYKPSTISSAASTGGAAGAKYRSSTLDRPSADSRWGGSDGFGSRNGGSATLRPFGSAAAAKSPPPVQSYNRSVE